MKCVEADGHKEATVQHQTIICAKRETPSLLKRLLREYDLSRVKEVQWGVNNEAEAVKALTTLTLKLEELSRKLAYGWMALESLVLPKTGFRMYTLFWRSSTLIWKGI